MNRRTIMIDEDIEAKIRDTQAQLILNTNSNWSFSTVANLLILAGITGSDKLSKDDWNTIKSFVTGEDISIKKKNIKKLLTNLAN